VTHNKKAEQCSAFLRSYKMIYFLSALAGAFLALAAGLAAAFDFAAGFSAVLAGAFLALAAGLVAAFGFAAGFSAAFTGAFLAGAFLVVAFGAVLLMALIAALKRLF
jgi:hypothetical protein